MTSPIAPTRTAPLITLALFLALALASGSVAATTRHAPTRTRANEARVLEAGVRSAITGDYRLAVYVLWHNRLPVSATRWTRGPALAALRAAAAARKKTGVRIRLLTAHRKIVSLTLNRARTEATVVVSARELVRPSNPGGHSLGRTITLKERGRFLLHRIGTRRFIVWKVTALS